MYGSVALDGAHQTICSRMFSTIKFSTHPCSTRRTEESGSGRTAIAYNRYSYRYLCTLGSRVLPTIRSALERNKDIIRRTISLEINCLNMFHNNFSARSLLVVFFIRSNWLC